MQMRLVQMILNETIKILIQIEYQDATMSTIEWIKRENGDLKVKYSYQTLKAQHTDDNDKGVSTLLSLIPELVHY